MHKMVLLEKFQIIERILTAYTFSLHVGVASILEHITMSMFEKSRENFPSFLWKEGLGENGED